MSEIEPAAAEAEDLNDEPRPPTRWQLILGNSTVWIFAILILIVVGFTAYEPTAFPTVANFRNIATDASVLLILAVGETFVIITAGIDLSVGSVLLFGGVVSAKVMASMGGDSTGVILVGLVVAMAGGLGWGLFNGLVITKMKVPPLIVTLGSLGMALGAALLLTGGVDVRSVPNNLVLTVGIGRVAGVPYLVLIAGGVAIVSGLVLWITRFGRWTYGIGSNAEAARRAGINVDRHLIKVYALAGLLAGLAGWLNLARFSTTTVGGHATDNLNAIAAVVIGGTSLFGGVGAIAGTVVGVFIPAVLSNGFNVIGVQPFWQDVAVGAVLILAVYLDQLRRRAKQQV
ncbi:MAG: ABC transporter permease [Solirubrobacteraceae bacterium]